MTSSLASLCLETCTVNRNWNNSKGIKALALHSANANSNT